MKWNSKLLWVGVCLALTFTPLQAAEPAPTTDDSSGISNPANPDPKRFLFIVDISESMDDLRNEGRQALFDLILTGCYGYMRHGDTFGLWLFNKDVYTGKYPMQVWDTNTILSLASKATLFVKDQRYQYRSRMKEALAPALKVAENVKDLNIIFVSDDHAKMVGTPFDDFINHAYKTRDSEASERGVPIITTLVAQNGIINQALITLPGEPIGFKPRVQILPPPPPAKTVAAPPAVPAPQKTEPKSPPPNIIISRKTSQPPEPEPTPSAPATPPDGKESPFLGQIVAFGPGATSVPDPHLISIIEKAKQSSSPASKGVIITHPAPSTTPQATAEPSGVTPGAIEAVDKQPPPATAASAEPNPVTDPPAAPTSETPPSSVVTSLATLDPAPTRVQARESTPSIPAAQLAPPVRPGMAAWTGTLPKSRLPSWYWWAGGAGCLLLALVLALTFVRLHRRAHHQTSFITQSMVRR